VLHQSRLQKVGEDGNTCKYHQYSDKCFKAVTYSVARSCEIWRTRSKDSSIATSVVDPVSGSTLTQRHHPEAEATDCSAESLCDGIREIRNGLPQASTSDSLGGTQQSSIHTVDHKHLQDTICIVFVKDLIR